MASKWLWCIFQLPLINGLRPSNGWPPSARLPRRIARLPERGEPREVALLDQLERRSATGRHVVDAVVEPELVDRGDDVAAAHHGEARRLGDGLRHRSRA